MSKQQIFRAEIRLFSTPEDEFFLFDSDHMDPDAIRYKGEQLSSRMNAAAQALEVLMEQGWEFSDEYGIWGGEAMDRLVLFKTCTTAQATTDIKGLHGDNGGAAAFYRIDKDGFSYHLLHLVKGKLLTSCEDD